MNEARAATAFPLQWPDGYKRTPWSQRARSAFKASYESSVDEVRRQVRLLGAGSVVIATRVKYRELALRHHPDRGGDPSRMSEINRAYEEAKRAVGT